MSLELASSFPLPAGIALSRVLRSIAHVARALSHRRDVRLLLELDERALKDIGLLRGDVVGALSETWDRDPSTLLMVRSVERRARARAAGIKAMRDSVQTG